MEIMETPNTLYVYCPQCEEETLHQVLKGKTGTKGDITFDCTVQCNNCKFVHHTVIKTEKPMVIPVVISDHAVSTPSELECYPDEHFTVDEELYIGESNYKITSIETEDGRVEGAPADEIETLWLKKYDWVRVKVSVNRGARTFSHELRARPEEEFAIGDVFFLRGMKIAIHKIKTEDAKLSWGAEEARNIVRLYGRTVR